MTCNTDLLRDYAFDELPAADRPALQRHISECSGCAAELDQLRLTTAALRVLPDQEPPRRIAFISDKVFAPSRLWNFAPWLGFASAGVMAVTLIFTVAHRPVEVQTVYVKPQPVPIDDIVKKAVAQTRAEDAQLFNARFEASEAKHDKEHKFLIEALTVMQQGHNTDLLLSSTNTTQNGAGQ